MHVLIIEDNPDIAANLGDYLEDRGHTVDFAGDGVTGLHLAVVNNFDAIVLDLALPGMDGLEVCRKLRQEAGKDTPVLILTARDRLEDKLAGFDTGADDYLVKPFELQEVEARLKVLASRGRRLNQRELRVLLEYPAHSYRAACSRAANTPVFRNALIPWRRYRCLLHRIRIRWLDHPQSENLCTGIDSFRCHQRSIRAIF